jgi:hypothetical protein
MNTRLFLKSMSLLTALALFYASGLLSQMAHALAMDSGYGQLNDGILSGSNFLVAVFLLMVAVSLWGVARSLPRSVPPTYLATQEFERVQ